MSPEAASRLLRITGKTSEPAEQPAPGEAPPGELARGPGPYSASA
jgi:hypothetical protein